MKELQEQREKLEEDLNQLNMDLEENHGMSVVQWMIYGYLRLAAKSIVKITSFSIYWLTVKSFVLF